MGWWIFLAVVVGLAILPLGVSVRYNADGICLAVIAGPVRIKILPVRKKEKKEKKPKKEKKSRESPVPEPVPKPEAEPCPEPVPEPPAPEPQPVRKKEPAQPPATTPAEKYPNLEKKPGKVKKERRPREEPAEESGGSWTDFLSLIPIVFDFLGDFRRKLRVNRLELKLILAADDPCDLAINYGRAWTALGNLLPQLERFLVIQKRDLEVECDFTASKTLVIARLDLTITLGRILAAVVKFAFRALMEFLKIMKKRKGGAVKNEQ